MRKKWTEETIESELRRIIEEYKFPYYPKRSELNRIVGDGSLDLAIQKHNGHTWWANKLGLPTNTKGGRKWDDSKCIEKIQEAVDYFKTLQDYFPTTKQIIDFCGDTGLTNYIFKNFGKIYKLAEKNNLPLKDSGYAIGLKGENILESKLKELGYQVNKEPTTCIYDFTVNNYVRVDCKYSTVYHGKNGDFYSFNIEDSHPDCDIFICIFEDECTKNNRFLVIPHVFVFNQKQISVGIYNSKWFYFENRFDYINRYEQFCKGVLNG